MTLDHLLLLNRLAKLQKTISYACDKRLEGWEQYRDLPKLASEAIKTLAAGNDNYVKTMSAIDEAAQAEAAAIVTTRARLVAAERLMEQLITNQGNGVWWANEIRTFLADQGAVS